MRGPAEWLARLRGRPPLELIIVTDPGPDPDDLKALLVAAVLHKQGTVRVRAVIANGGGQPEARAKLALAAFQLVDTEDIPVGVGSRGSATTTQPHEYKLEGYDEVDTARLVPGDTLLLDALRTAHRRSVTMLLISSMRDFADVIGSAPELVREKVATVAVQGGLERDGEGGWRPDSAVNNQFDMAAAEAVYSWCFAHGVELRVTSRAAVPLLPMQLARSFAMRTRCPLMRYLADAQFLGLEGLWRRLCAGELPARCTKQWYFETFCGATADTFAREGLDALGADADIVSYLEGYVKPYDVVALMTVLPSTAEAFTGMGGAWVGVAASAAGGRRVRHLLLLSPELTVPADTVALLLRQTYHQAVLATAGKSESHALRRRSVSDVESVQAGAASVASAAGAQTYYGRLSGKNELGRRSAYDSKPLDGAGVRSRSEIVALLERAVRAAHARPRSRALAETACFGALLALSGLAQPPGGWPERRLAGAALRLAGAALGTAGARWAWVRVPARLSSALSELASSVSSVSGARAGGLARVGGLLDGLARGLMGSYLHSVPRPLLVIAAAIGYGTDTPAVPRTLVDEALRVHHGVTLSGEDALGHIERAMLANAPLARGRTPRGLGERARAAAAGPREPASTHELRVQRATALALDDDAAAPDGAGGADAPAAAEREVVDCHVIHSFEDAPRARVAALRAYAAEHRAATGRAPRIWIDVVCWDPSIAEGIQWDPTPRLAHTVVYLCRARRLLVLLGDTLFDRLWCAFELYLWRTLGRSLADVDVRPLCPLASRETIVAQIDAFHVMYTGGMRSMRGFGRLADIIQLAPVWRFNEVVRSYMPTVRDAPWEEGPEHAAEDDDALEWYERGVSFSGPAEPAQQLAPSAGSPPPGSPAHPARLGGAAPRASERAP